MKSQDIVLLLKLAILFHSDRGVPFYWKQMERKDPHESYEPGYSSPIYKNDFMNEMAADLGPNKKRLKIQLRLNTACEY